MAAETLVARDQLWPRWVWLRALGLIFVSVFVSLATQIHGLIGPQGILPAGEYLSEVREALGFRALWYAPTLLWLSSSRAALTALVAIGLLASLLLVLNVAPRASLAASFVCFLSFIAAAQDFASYQSDGMLLEAAFISLFLTPRGLRPGLGEESAPPRFAVFLLLFEWFRIYFESGVVKILSGDEQWRTLTALDHYYENGPLPSFVGWYVQMLLPHAFHAATVVLTFVVELGVVWLAFCGRTARLVTFFVVSPFQAAIILTANYAFLNYIVLFLGVWLLDDRFLRRPTMARPPQRSVARTMILALLLFVTVTVAPGIPQLLPRVLLMPAIALQPFRIANRYGLFAVMTKERYELEFQGSRDGETWTPYEFRFKPQRVDEAPGLYAPYQPRFEWNLWFASLGSVETHPWVVRAQLRLMEGSRDVLRLFRRDPFEGKPPKFVRVVKYQYWFATPEEHRRGLWWRREFLGEYAPRIAF